MIHVACVLLTFVSFSVRGLWMIGESSLLKHPLVRVAPHVVDTCLLLSGLTMAIYFYGAFYTQGWIMAKLTALLAYIYTGSVALRYGRTKTVRTAALLISWLIFFYIVVVALTRTPFPVSGS